MTDAMRMAAREVLGPALEIRLESESDAARKRNTSPTAQTAEVHVRWNATGTTATVQLTGDGSSVWAERHVTFALEDSPAERGRTLGYMIAALLPAPRAAPPATVEPKTVELKTIEPKTVEPKTVEPKTVEPTREPPAPDRIESNLLSAREADWAASLAVYGAVSLGLADDGASTAYGGGAAATWRPAAAFGLSTRIEARAGSVSEVQATSLWLAAKAGAGYRALRIADFSLWLRADIGVARESVSHFSADDPKPVEHAHWIPVSDAGLDFDFRFSPALVLAVGVGADVVWGTTDVFVHHERRASLAILRPMVTLGVAASL